MLRTLRAANAFDFFDSSEKKPFSDGDWHKRVVDAALVPPDVQPGLIVHPHGYDLHMIFVGTFSRHVVDDWDGFVLATLALYPRHWVGSFNLHW